jgi:hypothetical protein
MFSEESDDFGELLEALGKMIGVNLDRDPKQES